MALERVNPDHVGIVWGLRVRKGRKSRGNNKIRMGKVYFEILPVAMGLTFTGFLDALTNYSHMLLMQVSFGSMVLYTAFSLVFWYQLLQIGGLKHKWMSETLSS